MHLSRRLIVFLALALLAGLFSLSRRVSDPAERAGRRGLTVLTRPIEWLVSGARNQTVAAWRWSGDMLRLREDNVELRTEVAALHRELRRREEDRIENERLRHLLGLPAPDDMRQVAANVVGRDPTNWFRTIRIDRGLGDGVLIDSPVVAESGVVGHVIEATADRATVLLLLDANCRVAAVLRDSREQGLIEGLGAAHVRLTYVDRTAELRPEATVLTSGMGGIYPKGLLVGRVTGIVPQEHDLFQLALVQPSVDFTRLEHVIVLLPSLDTEAPAVADVAAS